MTQNGLAAGHPSAALTPEQFTEIVTDRIADSIWSHMVENETGMLALMGDFPKALGANAVDKWLEAVEHLALFYELVDKDAKSRAGGRGAEAASPAVDTASRAVSVVPASNTPSAAPAPQRAVARPASPPAPPPAPPAPKARMRTYQVVRKGPPPVIGESEMRAVASSMADSEMDNLSPVPDPVPNPPKYPNRQSSTYYERGVFLMRLLKRVEEEARKKDIQAERPKYTASSLARAVEGSKPFEGLTFGSVVGAVISTLRLYPETFEPTVEGLWRWKGVGMLELKTF